MTDALSRAAASQAGLYGLRAAVCVERKKCLSHTARHAQQRNQIAKARARL